MDCLVTQIDAFIVLWWTCHLFCLFVNYDKNTVIIHLEQEISGRYPFDMICITKHPLLDIALRARKEERDDCDKSRAFLNKHELNYKRLPWKSWNMLENFSIHQSSSGSWQSGILGHGFWPVKFLIYACHGLIKDVAMVWWDDQLSFLGLKLWIPRGTESFFYMMPSGCGPCARVCVGGCMDAPLVEVTQD